MNQKHKYCWINLSCIIEAICIPGALTIMLVCLNMRLEGALSGITSVLVYDHSVKQRYVQIKDMKAGDTVVTYNPVTRLCEQAHVMNVFSKVVSNIVVLKTARSQIVSAEDQWYYCYDMAHKRGNWIAARMLKKGDIVLCKQGNRFRTCIIEAISKIKQPTKLYEVVLAGEQGLHWFFSGPEGVLTHNLNFVPFFIQVIEYVKKNKEMILVHLDGLFGLVLLTLGIHWTLYDWSPAVRDWTHRTGYRVKKTLGFESALKAKKPVKPVLND